MYKIGGRKNVNTHYQLNYKRASWFWRKDCSLVLPSGLEINVCLLLRRAGTFVLLTEWEGEGFDLADDLEGGLCCSHWLSWTDGQLEVVPSMLWYVSLQLSCACHICCDTALWPSHFMSPLHCHALRSCLRWHDTFSIPFSFFCLFPLLLSFVFDFGFIFPKQAKQELFYDVSQHHKNSQIKYSTNQSYQFPHTSVFLCSSQLFFLEVWLYVLTPKK